MPHHHERRHLPHSAEQMYNLVADVARYPEFLPWVSAIRIRKDEEDEMKILVKNAMEHAIKLSVPMEVEMELGVNWLDAHW